MAHRVELLYIANDNLIELTGLRHAVDSSALDNTSTVQVTIKDAEGNAVAGQSWPLTLAFVSAGMFRATLSRSLVLTNGEKYDALILATSQTGAQAQWQRPLLATIRT